MVVKRMSLIGGLIVAMLICMSSSATAYIVDGYVDDWGIDLSLATSAGYLDTYLPSGVFYVTEDNADSSSGHTYVGPGWSDDNYFDAEAMYFTNDDTYAYFTLIHGMPIDGHSSYLPGDIGFDINQDGVYDFGIDTSSFSGTTAELYATPSLNSWLPAQLFPGSNPWAVDIAQSSSLGFIDFVYSELQNSHYVLEGRIPLSLLGLSTGDLLTMHWTQQCGNDALTLYAQIVPVPEPTSVLLFMHGLLAFGIAGLRKSKKHKKI